MSVLSRETVLKWMLGTLTSTYRFISKRTYTYTHRVQGRMFYLEYLICYITFSSI